MRAIWKNQVIANSQNTIIVEGNHYFPPDSVKLEYLKSSDTPYICPWKGEAEYFDLKVGENMNYDAAWCYPDPEKAAQQIKRFIAFENSIEIKE